MYLTKPLSLLFLASTALSFDIRAFPDKDCAGEATEINVYDNTCKGSVPGINSFQVLAYGAHRQRAGFYSDGSCNGLGRLWTDWWADGGSDTFKKGDCINVGFGAYSMGSRSA